MKHPQTTTNASWNPTAEELAELDARDERVKIQVLAAIEDAWEESRNLEDQAKEMRVYARKLKDACSKGHWWDLKGVASKEDIESLCNVSPSGLLEDS